MIGIVVAHSTQRLPHVLRHACCYDARFAGHMGYSKRLVRLYLAFICVLSFYKLVTVRLTCKMQPNKTNVLTGIRLCLVVTFHTITRALLFFFFPLPSFHHCSSVSGKKHVGQDVNTHTWYESQRCEMKELQHKITHIVCGIIFRLNKHDCIMLSAD